MGAQQSTPTTLYPPQPPTNVQFSPELIAQLADPSAVPSPARQSSLDDQIKHKLELSLQSLKAHQSALTADLHSAIQAPNLSGQEKAGGAGSGTSSELLRGDIEEIRRKVERFEKRRRLDDWPEVGVAKEGVRVCYLKNPTTTLDCWKEAEAFKVAVGKLEQNFVASLQ